MLKPISYSEERPRALSGLWGSGCVRVGGTDGSHGANVSRAWEAQVRVHARVYARVVRREIFARLRRAYRNRGPASRPPDFLYTVRNSVQNRLRISYMRFLRLYLLL